MRARSIARVVAVIAALGPGCGDDDGTAATSAAGTSGGETSTTLPDSTGTEASSNGATDTADSDDTSAVGAECSLYDQDCPNGEKCVPWSDEPDLVPDEIRCCPETGSKQVDDVCTVEGYFGSCLDDCALGSFCMDLDGDGTGVCLGMCEGSAAAPQCDTDQSCLIYFAGVPLCFDLCDPLIQDCPDGTGCYPDEEAAGNTGFICLPTVGTSGVGDYCWLLSNCEPGLICVTSDYFPGCDGLVGCCTQLCDVTEPDPCPEISPELECTSWFVSGQMPPQAYLQNVGACVIPG